MNSQQRAAVVDWLAGLTDAEFVDVFYEARALREALGPQPVTERYAIQYLELDDGEWWFDSVAPAADRDGRNEIRVDGTFAWGGVCDECDCHVVSWHAAPQCPICGNRLPPQPPEDD